MESGLAEQKQALAIEGAQLCQVQLSELRLLFPYLPPRDVEIQRLDSLNCFCLSRVVRITLVYITDARTCTEKSGLSLALAVNVAV